VYPESDTIQKQIKEAKLKNIKSQEIANFHRLRNLFPQMTSINTTKLNQIKEFEAAHRGPGTYNLDAKKT